MYIFIFHHFLLFYLNISLHLVLEKRLTWLLPTFAQVFDASHTTNYPAHAELLVISITNGVSSLKARALEVTTQGGD